MDANATVHPPKKPASNAQKFVVIFGVFLFCVLVLVLLIRFSVFSKGRVEMLRYEATKAHDHGHYDTAIEKYKKVLAINPNDTEIRYNLGVVYLSNKQVGKAREQMQTLRDQGNDEYANILKELLDNGLEKSKDRSRRR